MALIGTETRGFLFCAGVGLGFGGRVAAVRALMAESSYAELLVMQDELKRLLSCRLHD